MRHPWKTDLQGRLSWFLIAYLTMLLGVLLAVHVLPAWGGEGSAWRSPVYQQRQIKAKRTANAVVFQTAGLWPDGRGASHASRPSLHSDQRHRR